MVYHEVTKKDELSWYDKMRIREDTINYTVAYGIAKSFKEMLLYYYDTTLKLVHEEMLKDECAFRIDHTIAQGPAVVRYSNSYESKLGLLTPFNHLLYLMNTVNVQVDFRGAINFNRCRFIKDLYDRTKPSFPGDDRRFISSKLHKIMSDFFNEYTGIWDFNIKEKLDFTSSGSTIFREFENYCWFNDNGISLTNFIILAECIYSQGFTISLIDKKSNKVIEEFSITPEKERGECFKRRCYMDAMNIYRTILLEYYKRKLDDKKGLELYIEGIFNKANEDTLHFFDNDKDVLLNIKYADISSNMLPLNKLFPYGEYFAKRYTEEEFNDRIKKIGWSPKRNNRRNVIYEMIDENTYIFTNGDTMTDYRMKYYYRVVTIHDFIKRLLRADKMRKADSINHYNLLTLLAYIRYGKLNEPKPAKKTLIIRDEK